MEELCYRRLVNTMNGGRCLSCRPPRGSADDCSLPRDKINIAVVAVRSTPPRAGGSWARDVSCACAAGSRILAVGGPCARNAVRRPLCVCAQVTFGCRGALTKHERAARRGAARRVQASTRYSFHIPAARSRSLPRPRVSWHFLSTAPRASWPRRRGQSSRPWPERHACALDTDEPLEQLCDNDVVLRAVRPAWLTEVLASRESPSQTGFSRTPVQARQRKVWKNTNNLDN